MTIHSRFLFLSSVLALSPAVLPAQVPQLLHHQGRVQVDGTNFNGSGQFKFALVGGPVPTTHWSNNDTSVNGSEPSAAVTLPVANGLYSVALGDTALANMNPVPSWVFTNSEVRLRVWFNDGVLGSQLLTPDQRITAVGYAMIAANVPNGVITAEKLAAGAVTAEKIAAGTVTGSQIADNGIDSTRLADDIDLGSASVDGRLDVFRTAAGTPAISLIGNGSQISTYGSDGQEQARLWGAGWGELLLHDNSAQNYTTAQLVAQENLFFGLPFPALLPSPGGALRLSLGTTNRVYLKAGTSGGQLSLYQNDGGLGLLLDGDDQGAGAITVRSTNGSTRVLIDGENSGGGAIEVRRANGANAVTIDGASSQISTYGSDGQEQIRLWGSSYGELLLRDSSTENRTAVRLSANGTAGGVLQLYRNDGTATVTIDADVSGEGRVTTQVLQITGGSDLSEQFDIAAVDTELKPGLIVSIDPENPGRLLTSSSAYDKTVAGIVSGAGGVKPGMLMGQHGTAANGQHPVALTGRVYCWVDADHGAIRPGDLITTSNTPGHGMKVTDHARAQGAVIGKAMSSLAAGRGLVLVLVSLQ
jgi:hypothetical protein